MKYSTYKGIIEREYGKPLKKILKELCVDQGLTAAEGAKHLGVPKELFVYWRREYRFEKKQMLFDSAVEDLNSRKDKYKTEVKKIDVQRPLLFSDETSLRGFVELLDRKVELYKQLHYKSHGLAPETARLPFYEFAKEIAVQYQEGRLENDKDK